MRLLFSIIVIILLLAVLKPLYYKFFVPKYGDVFKDLFKQVDTIMENLGRILKISGKIIIVVFVISIIISIVSSFNESGNTKSNNKKSALKSIPEQTKPMSSKPKDIQTVVTLVVEEELLEHIQLDLIIDNQKQIISKDSQIKYENVDYDTEQILYHSARSYSFKAYTYDKPIIKVIPEILPSVKARVRENPEVLMTEVNGRYRISVLSGNNTAFEKNSFTWRKIGELLKEDLSNDGFLGDAITIDAGKYVSLD